MRWILVLALLTLPQLTLPLAAQTWDLRLEVPFPKGQGLHSTLVRGTGQLASGDLDTGNGAIFSINHRLLRVGPILRLEWGGELAQWRADGNIYFNGPGGAVPADYSSTLGTSLTQTGIGFGVNAQLWVPFIGICGEIGAIQRFQQYKFSSGDFKSDDTIWRTWLRVGARWRVPFVPVLHPYIAASYQQPINKEQPLDIASVGDLAQLFTEQGKGQEFQRMWTFGVGITF